MDDDITRPVVSSPRVVDNYAGQPCYLVEYDEDQWNKYDAEAKEHCFDTWAARAKPMGCMFVVLRLYPDALFPSGEHTAPYVVRSYAVAQDEFDPYTLSTKLAVEIHADTWERGSEGQRILLKTGARRRIGMNAMAAKGVSYEIWTRTADGPTILERGKL